MAVSDNSLDIVVRLKNEVSNNAKALVRDLSGSLSTLKTDLAALHKDWKTGAINSIEATKGLGIIMKNFALSMGPVLVVVGAVTAAFLFLKNAFESSLPSLLAYGQGMAKLENISIRFGQNAEDAKRAAIALSEDGLVNTATAAEGLARLLSTGLNIDQAVKLMGAYKDMAALGRSSTIDMNTAILNLSQGFVTERSQLVDNSGQWENFSDVIELGAASLGKTVNELSNAERTQAKYNGTLMIAQRAQGDAARLSGTYAGQMARLNQTIFNLQVAFAALAINIAKVVLPALTALAGWLTNFIERLFPGAIEAGKNFVMGLKNASAISDELRDAIGGMGSKASDTLKRVANEIRDFGRDMAKMASDFKRRLADMVFSHKDKVEQLKKQIDEERRNLNERLDKMAQPYEDLKKAAIQAGEDRLTDLKVQLDKELAKGKNANAEKIAMLQEFISEEEVAIRESIKEYEMKKNKEIALEREKGEGRINELQKELNDELAILEKHRGVIASIKDIQREDDITRLIREYSEEKALRTTQHQERLADLRTQGSDMGIAFGSGLGDTLGISISDAIKMAMTEEEPIKVGLMDVIKEVPGVLADIWKGLGISFQGLGLVKMENIVPASSTLASWGKTIASGIQSGFNTFLQSVAGFYSSIRNNINVAINTAYTWGKTFISNFWSGVQAVALNVSAIAKDLVNKIIDWINTALSRSFWPLTSLRIPKFAQGVENFRGGMAVVGERGPELVNLPRGSDVIPNNQIGSAGGVTQNFVFNQVSTAFDVQLAMERAAMMARRGFR